MKCNMCGREVDEKESFCLYCGSKLKKNNNNKIPKKEEKKEEVKIVDNDEKDNTFKVAGITALCLLPGIIFSIIMYYRYISKPSYEFQGIVPVFLIAYTFLFFAIILILIPILIIIIGALTGLFRKNKNK